MEMDLSHVDSSPNICVKSRLDSSKVNDAMVSESQIEGQDETNLFEEEKLGRYSNSHTSGKEQESERIDSAGSLLVTAQPSVPQSAYKSAEATERALPPSSPKFVSD